MTLSIYIYSRIPGAHPTWTLALLATSRREADSYMRNVWRGGKFVRKVEGGAVKASCGAVTDEARLVMMARLEETA